MADVDIATSYATALAEALTSPDDLAKVGADLEQMTALVRELPSMIRVLDHPGQPIAKRRGLLDMVLSRIGAHPTTARFLHLVLDKGRMPVLPDMVAKFQELRDERLNVASAEVVTAAPIDAGLRAEWEQVLARLTGREVRVSFRTDKALIGGAVTKVGSVVYDGSLRKQLSRIRRVLLA
ncbi:MAG TPA: ATP synthase F1 subunit delta [Candidatus Polarisedimenticolia bacterium]|nr:ATP synthase F1 subunit delta [Candidatus Polarisedimenticolia bacterium]